MTGRPTSYSEEMQEAADSYISEYQTEHGHPLPSVVGMAVVLGVAKSTLYKWAEDGRGNFSDTLEACNNNQELKLTHGGLEGVFNSTITKLMLHGHGHNDKIDTDITSGGKEIKNDWHIHPVTTDKS